MFVLDAIKRYAATGRVALVNREERLTFTALHRQSDAFAAWLLERLGDDRSPVVLYGHKETGLLPCIFGALKSGRPYVPVDISTPPSRAAEIVADVKPGVVVDFTGRLTLAATVLGAATVERILTLPQTHEIPLSARVAGDDIAYILFTSGSTGKPKGVSITARNLAAFYHGLLPYLGRKEGGVALNQVSYAFDVSGCSLYGALCRGMTLFTVDKEMAADLRGMYEAMRQSGLTYWVSTPSFAEVAVQSSLFSEELLPGLTRFLFCGEVLTHKLCDQLTARFPKAKIINTYGPTEATVLVTAAVITEKMRADSRSIPIGKPLEGTVLGLDKESGELLILGDSVGPGYYGRPDLTAERFFTDEATGLRGYRTGDLCEKKYGVYYYKGRIDNQLKLNGFRVELEDIEQNLAALPTVARAAVIPVWEGERVSHLAAFLLLAEEDGLTNLGRSIRLRKLAAERLPAYMIPRKIIAVDSFPLSQSGKVDKKELAKRLAADS